MDREQVVCPLCGRPDAVEKVSLLYLTGLGMRSPGGAPQAVSAGMQALSRKLAPPASQKQAFTRPVHPDTAVLAFSLVMPFFLYGILSTQREMLLVALAILVLFYAIYFSLRSKLVARFMAEQTRQKADAERIQRAIERWMKLYYCARDDGVFEPGAGELVPVDMMKDHLLQAA